MTPRAAFWKWSILGAVVSTLLLLAQSTAVGGATGLLQVGEDSQLRQLIESELGEVPLFASSGHDGQIYYAIGLDLTGEEVGPLLDHGGYGYRRILYPLISSALGQLDGYSLLAGMVVTTVISAAVASGVTAATARRLGRSDWLALAVIFNPGVWLSVRLLTADVTALAFMVIGLYAVVMRSRTTSTVMFALSGLAKDVYLVTPGGLAAGRDRRRWLLILVPAAVLLLWMIWLDTTVGEGFTSRRNLALPVMGVIDAAGTWKGNLNGREWFYLGFALVSVSVGLVFAALRSTWMRWSILGWSLLAIISSDWVWNLGNNAARAFAPILVLLALGAADSKATQVEEIRGHRQRVVTTGDNR